MPVVAADIQRIIVLRVGDIDPATGDPPQAGGAGMVASNISTLWAAHADKAVVAPRLQELYVERDARRMVLAFDGRQVDQTVANDQVKLSQITAYHQKELDRLQAEIEKLEQRAMSMAGGKVGRITTGAPVTVEDELNRKWPIIPDPNSPDYSGSPYRPSRFPIGNR